MNFGDGEPVFADASWPDQGDEVLLRLAQQIAEPRDLALPADEGR